MKLLTLIALWGMLTLQSFALNDSLMIHQIVSNEISKAKEKEQAPIVPKKANQEIQSIQAGAIPQTVFFGVFIGTQILLAMAFFLFKQKNKVERIAIIPRKRADMNRTDTKNLKKNSYNKKATTIVSCQIQLVKTREELIEQARKMNVGSGELELAHKLQEFSTQS